MTRRNEYDWKGKRRHNQPYFKRFTQSLHFRNVAPKQTRPKGVRKENPKMYHPFIRNFTLGYYTETAYGDGLSPIGGQAAEIANQIQNRVIWTNYRQPTRVIWDDKLYREANGQMLEVANTQLSDSWMHAVDGAWVSHQNEETIVQHRVGHQYWLHCSEDVEPGSITTESQVNPTSGLIVAEYLGGVDGNHTWRSTQTYNAPHKYTSIWATVKDWVSDDGTITAEDYYRRVTGHVLFRDVTFSDKVYPAVTFPKVNCILPLNQWISHLSKLTPIIQGTIPDYDDFLWDCRIHDHLIELRLRHKSDLNGPCRTCLHLMERTPIAVEGILL